MRIMRLFFEKHVDFRHKWQPQKNDLWQNLRYTIPAHLNFHLSVPPMDIVSSSGFFILEDFLQSLWFQVNSYPVRWVRFMKGFGGLVDPTAEKIFSFLKALFYLLFVIKVKINVFFIHLVTRKTIGPVKLLFSGHIFAIKKVE